MHSCLLARRRRLVPLAAVHGRVPRLGKCRTRSRFGLDHVDQGVRAAACAHANEAASPDHEPAPPRPPATLSMVPARQRGWLGSPSTAGAARARRNRPGSRHGGRAAVRSLADHRPFTRSPARSPVDHSPLGGPQPPAKTAGMERPRRPGVLRLLCPAGREPPGSRRALPCSAASRTCEPRAGVPSARPRPAWLWPGTYPAAVQLDLQVRVAAPAGPAPPPATGGRPEARRASA
jgi:hypothetical protein